MPISNPDGIVNGFISGGNTTAEFTADGKCVTGNVLGTLSGTITTFTQRTPTSLFEPTRFDIESDDGTVVVTLNSPQFITVVYENSRVTTTYTNTGETFPTIPYCVAEVTATRLSEGKWSGSLMVKCPPVRYEAKPCDGLLLSVGGVFDGFVTVNRQVVCSKPPKAMTP